QTFESIPTLVSGEPDEAVASNILEDPEDGRVKLYVTSKALCLRKEHPDVFEVGEYLPLTVQGAKANHAMAFIRKFEDQSVLVVVPRLVAGLLGEKDVPPMGAEVWKDTQGLLPTCDCSKANRKVYTGEG